MESVLVAEDAAIQHAVNGLHQRKAELKSLLTRERAERREEQVYR